ncbi:MAG TPA: hypothetical protein VNJ08_13540 [Bacteriovoracaceae bacterium]|nr:hypothetical protein [Bacteriovoracaceae bacterium]
MIRLLLLLFLLPQSLLAQIVTASFDRTTLSQNPASATTRAFSQIALFSTSKTSESEINEQRSDNEIVPWEDDIKINKTGMYFTGHGKFSPELYLSQDKGTRTLALKDVTTDEHSNDVSIVNNMINLGLRMTQRLSVGFKVFAPSFSYKEDFIIDYSDNQSLQFSANSESSILGLGAGLTYMVMPGLYWGGYFINIKENMTFDTQVTDIDGTVSNDSGDETFGRKQFGAGISYLRGGRGRGVRFEAAVSKMIHTDLVGMEDGEELYSAFEFSYGWLTMGLNVKSRRNMYYNNIELIDYISGDKTFSEEFKPLYGFFLVLGKGGGHSLGVSGVAYKTSGKKELFGREQPATTSLQEVTLSYAYLF